MPCSKTSKCPHQRLTVAPSKRSASYSKCPSRPYPDPTKGSPRARVRSNLLVPLSRGSGSNSRPGKEVLPKGAFCNTNMAWKRGLVAS